MRVKERKNGDVTVMALTGDIMNDDDLEKFSERVQKLKEEGQNRVVLDLNGVRLINSGGVGMLVGTLTSLRNTGGDMKLANLSNKADTILVAILRLHSVFDITDTVEEAVAGFSTPLKTA